MRWPSPTSRSASAAGIGCVGDVGDELDVLARRQARNQVVELEDEADVLAAVLRERGVGRRREIEVLEAHPAGRRRVEAAEDVEQRGLAAARMAEQDEQLARDDVEIDAAQRRHLDLAHLVDLREAAHFEERPGHGAASVPSGALSRSSIANSVGGQPLGLTLVERWRLPQEPAIGRLDERREHHQEQVAGQVGADDAEALAVRHERAEPGRARARIRARPGGATAGEGAGP